MKFLNIFICHRGLRGEWHLLKPVFPAHDYRDVVGRAKQEARAEAGMTKPGNYGL